MYGQRRYQRPNKPVEQPVVDNSVPTFLCPHCNQVKTINNPYVELSALENGKLFMYTKMCSSCAELLKAWLKQ
jgi:hypothetical protein